MAVKRNKLNLFTHQFETQNMCSFQKFSSTVHASLVIFFFTTNLQATTIFNNFDTGGGFNSTSTDIIAAGTSTSILVVLGESPHGAHRSAVQFTVTGGNFLLDSITLPIAFDGSQNNTLRVSLSEDHNGVPGRTLETLDDKRQTWPVYSPSTPLKQTTTLTSTAKPILREGNKYWITTEVTSFVTEFGSLEYYWYKNTSGSTVPFLSQGSNGSLPSEPWDVISSPLNLAFSVDGNPIGNAFFMCEMIANQYPFEIESYIIGNGKQGILLGEYDTTDQLVCGDDIYFRGIYTQISPTSWHFFFVRLGGSGNGNCETHLYDGIWEGSKATSGTIFSKNGSDAVPLELFGGKCSTQ